MNQSQYNYQNQPPMSYPAPAAAVQQGPYVVPPPVGYPTRDGQQLPQQTGPVETKSRGDGFWKGCCAALCCCCVLDTCF
ncbi:hypothetical protein SAY87_031770 [Trapa incisa]|uniref:Cysteine-rich transmembrane domain-containing protein n=1 Tax=Trapa incisa TaxID=236973 RepID=A0AAN7KL53_9MYRT|nr:hypothetical protein SAY87_031770 [Trapa incisa]